MPSSSPPAHGLRELASLFCTVETVRGVTERNVCYYVKLTGGHGLEGTRV